MFLSKLIFNFFSKNWNLNTTQQFWVTVPVTNFQSWMSNRGCCCNAHSRAKVPCVHNRQSARWKCISQKFLKVHDQLFLSDGGFVWRMCWLADQTLMHFDCTLLSNSNLKISMHWLQQWKTINNIKCFVDFSFPACFGCHFCFHGHVKHEQAGWIDTICFVPQWKKARQPKELPLLMKLASFPHLTEHPFPQAQWQRWNTCHQLHTNDDCCN